MKYALLATIFVQSIILKMANCETAAEYRSEFGSKVTPTFNAAVSIYEHDMLSHLAGLTADSVSNDPSSVAKYLNCKVDLLLKSLRSCISTTDEIRGRADGDVLALTQQASSLESQASSLQSQVAQKTAYRDGLQKEIAALEQRFKTVGTYRLSGFQYKHLLAIGKSLRRNAVTCPYLRKEDTWTLGKDPDFFFFQTCHQGPEYERLRKLVDESNAIWKQIQALNAQITALNQQKTVVQTNLQAVSTQRNSINAVGAQMRVAEGRVSTFLGKAEVLATFVTKMVQFNDLMVPLKAVGEQLTAFGQSGSVLNVASEVLDRVTANLKILQVKLPQFPFVLNVPDC